MPSVVSIVGKSRSGKTSVIERLIGELRSRAYHVATIKQVRIAGDILKREVRLWWLAHKIISC